MPGKVLQSSCVLIDVIEEDAIWSGWSQSALDEWGRRGPVCINPVVYAELSPDFDTPAALDGLLGKVGIDYREIPREALFLAARVHQSYRRRGGESAPANPASPSAWCYRRCRAEQTLWRPFLRSG